MLLNRMVAATNYGLTLSGKKLVNALKGDGVKNPGLKQAWKAGGLAAAVAVKQPKLPKVISKEEEAEVRAMAKELGLSIPKDVKDW